MRAALICALLVLAACGSKKDATQRAGAAGQPAARACGPDDPAACFDAARAKCAAAAPPWRIETVAMGTVTASPAGLARLDFGGKQMFGTDAKEWLACLPVCPGGAPGAVCLPYHFSLSVSGETDAQCTRADTDAEPWHGRPSKLLTFTCPSATISMRLVPSLAPARDALRAVGAIEERSALMQLDGLVVEMKLGAEPVFEIADAAPAACSAFDLPADARRIDTPNDFAAMRAMAPELENNVQRATDETSRSLASSILDEGRTAALAALGRKCLGPRDHYDANEVHDCVVKHPELPVQQITGDAIAEVAARRAPEHAGIMIDALRTHVDEPLCRRFSPASPPPSK
jgi:hypothetical protein